MNARNKYAHTIATRVVKEHGKNHLSEFRHLGVDNYLQLHRLIGSVLLDNKTKMLLGNQGETLFYNSEKNFFICHNREGKSSTCFSPSDKEYFSSAELLRVTKEANAFKLGRAVQIENVDLEKAALFHKRNEQKFAKLIAQKTAEQKKEKNKQRREKSRLARRISSFKKEKKPSKAWRQQQVMLKQSIKGIVQQHKVIDRNAKSLASTGEAKLKNASKRNDLPGNKKWQKFIDNKKTLNNETKASGTKNVDRNDQQKHQEEKRGENQLKAKKWQDFLYKGPQKVSIEKDKTYTK